VGKQGSIVQHTTETEDRTSAVVDTDAKLKNLTAYRDSLRTMLGKSSVSVKDLVEIQEKLAEDSLNSTVKRQHERSWQTKPKRSPLNSISVWKGPAQTGVRLPRFGMHFVSRVQR
jgi:hypothetical protein